jgi:ankyrin repeat protein
MGNVEQVRFLVSQKADKNVKNNDGETPLDRARGMSRRDVVEYLSGVRGGVAI